jgi:NADH:ubiquinone oxidoreductase subunit F (NADH-binding)
MYWNNRIVKETVKYMHEGEEVTEYFYEISEVYYNDKDEPCGYCDPCLGGESVEEAKTVYERMAEAFTKPVLDSSKDFNHEFDRGEDGGKEI